jgi:hypothetical protein
MTDYGCSHDEMLLLVPEKYLQGVIPNHVRRKDKADGGGAPQDKVTARDRERFERWAHLGILQVYVWHHSEGFVAPRVSPPGPLSISYGHVGCLKARAFPPPRVSPPGPLSLGEVS